MAPNHSPSAESRADWVAPEQPSHHEQGLTEASTEKLTDIREVALLQVLLKLKASLNKFPSSDSLFIEYDSNINNSKFNGAIASATLLLLRAQIELFISTASNDERDSTRSTTNDHLNRLLTELGNQSLVGDAAERSLLSSIEAALSEFHKSNHNYA